ncbi:hypothetical protein CDAR_245421 [Caerostris darwini]|uniref:Uncharacterized protein n=1 Tax=Caerostris darwini TaxID=1538125 RepID=A0AAV4NY27_9ARAC|nr:hypothetical protein CDAR_245421 [Caerostris darwini]
MHFNDFCQTRSPGPTGGKVVERIDQHPKGEGLNPLAVSSLLEDSVTVDIVCLCIDCFLLWEFSSLSLI